MDVERVQNKLMGILFDDGVDKATAIQALIGCAYAVMLTTDDPVHYLGATANTFSAEWIRQNGGLPPTKVDKMGLM